VFSLLQENKKQENRDYRMESPFQHLYAKWISLEVAAHQLTAHKLTKQAADQHLLAQQATGQQLEAQDLSIHSMSPTWAMLYPAAWHQH
jgi:hypothetical protein